MKIYMHTGPTGPASPDAPVSGVKVLQHSSQGGGVEVWLWQNPGGNQIGECLTLKDAVKLIEDLKRVVRDQIKFPLHDGPCGSHCGCPNLNPEPHGGYVHCPMRGDPIQLKFWRGQAIEIETVTARRALELANDLIEAALRSEKYDG